MHPTLHQRYTQFTRAPLAYQSVTALPTLAARVAYVDAQYPSLLDETIDEYRRSFDYRHGIWYSRSVRLRIDANLVDAVLDIALDSRIVDTGFVDRVTPLVTERVGVPFRHWRTQLQEVIDGAGLRNGVYEHVSARVIPRVEEQLDEIVHGWRTAVDDVLHAHNAPSELGAHVMSWVV